MGFSLDVSIQLRNVLQKIVRRGVCLPSNQSTHEKKDPGFEGRLLTGKSGKQTIFINYYSFFTGSSDDDVTRKKSRKMRIRFSLGFRNEYDDVEDNWLFLEDSHVSGIVGLGMSETRHKMSWTFNNKGGFDMEVMAEEVFFYDVAYFIENSISEFTSSYEWEVPEHCK